jgi:very-short-patch-repair endonuclease
MKRIHNLNELKERRRELRQKATYHEYVLWSRLRGKQLGYKFRRQHSIGYYIADFYCPSKKLVIEVDGGYHDESDAQQYDLKRDAVIKNADFIVLRFKNQEIDQDIEKVLCTIKDILDYPSPVKEKG